MACRIGFIALLLLALVYGDRAHAASTERLQFAPVTLPRHTDYRHIEHYAPTVEAYREARDDSRFVMERVTYGSDGLRVYACLYRPRAVPEGQKLPVIVFNRGSYVRDDFSPEFLMPAHRLAEQGYLVIGPMLRGSGGAPGHDEMGGADVDDIFNIVPVLTALGYADTDRLFLYGESRGAIMSMIAARRHFPARAIAVYGLTADFSTLIGPGTPGHALAPKIWPRFGTEEAHLVQTRSPMQWADQIDVPVLIMHGADDQTVPPTQALEMARALMRAGKPCELKIFYGGNHVLTGRAAERDGDAVAWFRRFDHPQTGTRKGSTGIGYQQAAPAHRAASR
jgi:dipeptidyl aminopeptidase/acylaminoacyl peptidase